MDSETVQTVDGETLVIPARFRRELGIKSGDTLVVDVADGELRIRSLSSGIKRAQDIVQGFDPPSRSLSDELIAERRVESGRE